MYPRTLCCRAGTAVRLSSSRISAPPVTVVRTSFRALNIERYTWNQDFRLHQQLQKENVKIRRRRQKEEKYQRLKAYKPKKEAKRPQIDDITQARREEFINFVVANPGVEKILYRLQNERLEEFQERNAALREAKKREIKPENPVDGLLYQRRYKAPGQDRFLQPESMVLAHAQPSSRDWTPRLTKEEFKQQITGNFQLDEIAAAQKVIDDQILYNEQNPDAQKTLEEYEREVVLERRAGFLKTEVEKREALKEAREREAEMLVIKELPDDPKEDVLFDTLFGIRTIELNRPKKLHSLNGSMIRKIVPRLQEWAKSDLANIVIIKGAGPKAFCAGGDVADLAKDNTTGEEGQARSAAYFAMEYRLDHLIATYTKPFIAFMDGITMGGGVGLSVHAPIRIATERTVFAMPETTIGFFPDVGASFFLPRMNGAVGTYLALTSQRLKGVNAFYAGIATHYIHSTQLYALERRLAELPFKDYATLEERLDLINSTIEEFTTGLPYDEPMVISGDVRKAIDRCFSKKSIPEIIVALRQEAAQEDSPTKKWADETLETLHQRSPTSVYVSLRQMQLGRKWSIRETFQREYEMAARFMKHPDFTEGVHALLIRKDGKPAWDPTSIEAASSKRGIVDPFFILEGSERLKLLNDTDYTEYPFAKYSIPTEQHIEDVVRDKARDRRELMKFFMRERRGKQGVSEVVNEVLDRKTELKDGQVIWIEDESASKL